MTDEIYEMKDEADRNRRILEDPTFNRAFESMNQEILSQLISTPPEANEERERLYSMYRAGQLFVQQFAMKITDFDRELQTQPEVD